MHFDNTTNTRIIIYRNQFPIATCTNVYLGFMSVFLKDINLECPIGTPLEIELIDEDYGYISGERIPMVINGSGTNGTSLKLNDDENKITTWKDIMSRIKHKMIKSH